MYMLKYMTFLDFLDQKVMNTFHDLYIHMMNTEVLQSVNFKISSFDIWQTSWIPTEDSWLLMFSVHDASYYYRP